MSTPAPSDSSRGGFLRRIGRRAERLVFPDSKSAEEHWQRVVMIESVDAYIAALPPSAVTAVEISGDTHAGRPWREFTKLDYPEFDLCAPLEEKRRFDVVICEQVLEHVVDPWAAAANLKGLCTEGGRVIVSTPFLIKLHEVRMFMMEDYWRFTPRGLRTLLEGVGLEVEEVNSWGNRECVVGNFTHWSAYRKWMPLRNEPDFPVQVWAFARNPAS